MENSSRSLQNWQQTALCCLLILVFGICARLPALQGELIWDDHLLVEDNPMIKSPLLAVEAFRHSLFPDGSGGYYRPVQTVTYIFDYYFWATDPFGYHLSSVCWHLLGAILLFFLLQRLLSPLIRGSASSAAPAPGDNGRFALLTSFFVSLVWAVHPVHSAAVDYISGRADSLALVFAATSWLLYLRARSTAHAGLRGGSYALAAGAALLAICSRESGLTWMLIFLSWSFVFEKGLNPRARVALVAGCLAIAALYLGLRQLPQNATPDMLAAPGASTTAVLMMRSLGDYARLMFFPTNLHLERTVAGSMSIDYLAIAGGTLLAALAYGMWRRGAHRQLRVLGGSWFILAFLPISNLLPLNATVAEHWLYLPSIGLLIFFAGVAIEIPARHYKAAAAAACIAVVALTSRSAIRSSDWIDAETFFRRTFAAGGSNSRIGVNLAVVYARRGDHAKAEEILRKVLQISPGYSLARANVALALRQQGKSEEAAALLAAPAATAPPAKQKLSAVENSETALQQARVQKEKGNTAAALALLARARESNPHVWELVSLEADILGTTAGAEAALSLIEQFAHANWWHASAFIKLGRKQMEAANFAAADAAFRHAARLDVHDPVALGLLASSKVKQNQLSEACAIQQRAVERRPHDPHHRIVLAHILKRMGRDDDAHATLGRALAMQASATSSALP